jgi:hypothetical protein
MANQARTADVSDREVHRNAQGQPWGKPTTSLEANPEMRLRERIDKANRANESVPMQVSARQGNAQSKQLRC